MNYRDTSADDPPAERHFCRRGRRVVGTRHTFSRIEEPMRVKTLVSAVLVWAALAPGNVRAQYAPGNITPLDLRPPTAAAAGVTQAQYSPGSVNPLDLPPSTAGGPQGALGEAPPPTPEPRGRLSPWITSDRPCSCYAPAGGDGPILTELYARTGPSFILGGGTFDDTLQTGWAVEGGARLVLFDADLIRAWTVQFGVTHLYNHGKNPQIKVPFTTLVPGAGSDVDPNPQPELVRFGVDVPGVTIRSLNRTYVTLGLGREWYLMGSAACDDAPAWRFGVDFGGRYGMANLELWELRHRIDVIGGGFVAAHTDVEIPCGCCRVYAGFRAEWGYTWSDILQAQNKSDIQDLNLMMTLGVRF